MGKFLFAGMPMASAAAAALGRQGYLEKPVNWFA
jgi:hypothetical protein